jgi:hypothetical protein
VWGRATDATLDHDLQIIDPSWSGPALKTWLSTGANVRMAHDARRPIGKGISAETDNSGATWVKSAIADDQAKKFLRKKILTAYSVGVSNPLIKSDPSGRARNGIICGGQISELTICDRPSNPSCGVQLLTKSADGSAVYVGEVFKVKQTKPKKARKAAQAELKKALADWDATTAGASQGMLARQLERTWRTTDDPFEREASYAALTAMKGQAA